MEKIFDKLRSLQDILSKKYEIETEIEELNKKINSTISDYTLIEELISQRDTLEKNLEEKMDRWTYLNELAELIDQNKNNN